MEQKRLFEEIPLDDIRFEDVQAFFDLKKPEGQRVDYKRELYRLKEQEQKRELLADVCSFANSFGGHLFLGIHAKQGIPSGIVGVECADPDNEESRMIEIIREWSEPRLDAYTVKLISREIPTKPGRYVFVIRIEPSAAAPHAGYVNKVREYFVRHGNGKEPMNATELRDAFVASETGFQRMREFRNQGACPPTWERAQREEGDHPRGRAIDRRKSRSSS